MLGLEEIRQAKKRGAAVLKEGSTAISARYDADSSKVVIDLSSGLQIAFPHKNAQSLRIKGLDCRSERSKRRR